MKEIVVSVSKGVMDALLAKLTNLMAGNGANLMGVYKEIVFLRDELRTINALLEKLENTDELDPLAKDWRNQVKEVGYDIEDCLDNFMNNVGSVDSTVGFVNKISHFLKTLRARLETAKQIKELKTRMQEIKERHKRYKLDDCTSATETVDIDPRLSALYQEATSLVGIENPKKELINRLVDEGQQLKVVPILGFGGLGKTTLANEVYREIGGQFSCKAFVSISQKPNIAMLLSRVLSQLHQNPSSCSACEVQDLIDKLREYLQDKRYLIIVDDLWDVRAWNILRCAFPQNSQHSRVIVTTRIEDVARTCCSKPENIYSMKHLSEVDSRKLFFSRIFGCEDACPSQFTEVSCEILKKCGGLPLAIITISSILACQNTRFKDQWEHIQNSLLDIQFATNPTLEDMMHILDLSYKNLPRDLKACFLYLGIYPEDHMIKRDDLVRKWVAEGFVSNFHGRDPWDVAKNYFNELVNRSMIQPVYFGGYNIEVFDYRVHDMMLDLIIRRCKEDRFVITVQDSQAMAEVQDKVRRLSVSMSGNGAGDDMMSETTTNTSNLSQVRSLAIFGGLKQVTPLLEFKFLRVLFLELHKDVMRVDLTGITQLPLLRYLKVKCKAWYADFSERSVVLPNRIRMLRHLETLEIPFIAACVVPSDIVDLPILSHLDVSQGTRLPDGIGKVKSLRTLGCFSLPKSSPEDIKGLGELTNLVKLFLNSGTPNRRTGGHTPTEIWMNPLITSLDKLSNLKSLIVRSSSHACSADALSSFRPPFHDLERLDLPGLAFSGVPKWIGDLHCLRMLRLCVKAEGMSSSNSSSWEDVGIMSTLPSLHNLFLRIAGVPAKRTMISSNGFAVLKHFHFECDGASCQLAFDAGAMPNLQTLWLGIDADEWDKATPTGLEHLTCLEEIHGIAMIRKMEAMKDRLSKAAMIKGVFQEAADALPTLPTVDGGHMTRRGVEEGHV